MKQLNLTFLFIALSFACFAQKPQIKWGEEFKLKKGSTDLEVVCSDNSGVYLQEGHLVLKSYFVIGATARTSASLVKLDKNLSEIYRNDFNKELRDKEFEQFFVVRDKMFLFASEYSNKDHTKNIFAAEINKTSGELAGAWKPVTSMYKSARTDEINFKITLNADSSRIVTVSTVEGKGKNEYEVWEFDENLNAIGRPIVITNEFDPKTFQLEDLLYTINKKIILVGRVYEYMDGKKKKEKYLDFSRYSVRIYSNQGKLESEINTGINGKWLTSTKLVQEKNKDLVLAAFYSNEKKGKSIDGMLVQRIDPVSAKVISTSEKQINNSMLATAADETSNGANDDESKEDRKEREKLEKIKAEGEEFSKYMIFRNIFYTSDNGLVIIAETYHSYSYSTTSYQPGVNGMPGSTSTRYYTMYESGDMLMCKLDASGNIPWLQVLPKAQREVISTGGGGGGGLSFSYGTDFFAAYNRPFYSGFSAIQDNKNIFLFFNDHVENANVTQPGQKTKMAARFSKTDCFVVKVDEATGKLTRSKFFSNVDIPTAMPRLGSITDQTMYIVGKTDRILGKTKIAVAKVTLE